MSDREHNGYPENPDACGWCELGEFLAKDGRCSHCHCTPERAEELRARRTPDWDPAALRRMADRLSTGDRERQTMAAALRAEAHRIESAAPACTCERRKGLRYSHSVHEDNPDGHAVSCPLWGPPGEENWRQKSEAA